MSSHIHKEMARTNSTLNSQLRRKDDEFYTHYGDIEQEVNNYKSQFRGKVVYCNCDDFRTSNFFKYFASNFVSLGLKELICSHYVDQHIDIFEMDRSVVSPQVVRFDGERGVIDDMFGDGDFRSAECLALLGEADIIVTNPPFSLFRRYMSQIFRYKKKFLVVGNLNAMNYLSFFPYFHRGDVRLGVSKINDFFIPDDYPLRTKEYTVHDDGRRSVQVNTATWYTNLEHTHSRREILLTESYDESKYDRYDNYDAIEVGSIRRIPYDYAGYMGVPITFVERWNREQFELVGQSRLLMREQGLKSDFKINGQRMFMRLVIKNKKYEQ